MAVAASLSGLGRRNAFDAVAAAATDSVLVAAVAGSKVRVIAAFVNNTDAGVGTVTFNSKPAGAGTAITPPFEITTSSGFVLNECSSGWFESNEGEGLTVTTAAASATSVLVVYELVARTK